MRTNFPEAWSRLKASRARHPREDALEEYTQWTLLGQPIETAAAAEQEPAAAVASTQPPTETEEMYIKRRTEHLMHKNLSCRRHPGGQWFTVGGGGDGSCAFQVR